MEEFGYELQDIQIAKLIVPYEDKSKSPNSILNGKNLTGDRLLLYTSYTLENILKSVKPTIPEDKINKMLREIEDKREKNIIEELHFDEETLDLECSFINNRLDINGENENVIRDKYSINDIIKEIEEFSLIVPELKIPEENNKTAIEEESYKGTSEKNEEDDEPVTVSDEDMGKDDVSTKIHVAEGGSAIGDIDDDDDDDDENVEEGDDENVEGEDELVKSFLERQSLDYCQERNEDPICWNKNLVGKIKWLKEKNEFIEEGEQYAKIFIDRNLSKEEEKEIKNKKKMRRKYQI